MGVIQIENLVKKYGSNLAVDDLSLDIEGGKVYGFLGPNGAGKSTTMNIITGYIGATKGTVKIDGYDIFAQSKKAKSKVGYLPEQPPLYQELTVAEYLKFVAELKGIPKKERKAAIENAIEKTAIGDVANRLIKNLSKGYKQRVGIAQAIIDMPEIIILDEPTVGLDPNQIVEIRNLIKTLGEDHTVILSSHLLPEVSEVCDYIYVINEGKLVAEGTEEELTQNVEFERTLEVTIQGALPVVEALMASLFAEGTYTITEQNGAVLVSVVVADDDNDVRTQLFNACAENNLPIVGMNYKHNSLEEIFMELTKKDEVESYEEDSEEAFDEEKDFDAESEYGEEDSEGEETQTETEDDVFVERTVVELTADKKEEVSEDESDL